jgi:hypothetical protein
MVIRIAATFVATLALLLGSAASAGADPTQHFTGSFDVVCGGNTLTIVEKPGSSNVITVNGEPSNSVSILFGVTIREDGEVVFDMQKATNNPNVVECTVPAEPGTEITVRVINTPPGG